MNGDQPSIGYTCPACKQYVTFGTIHVCPALQGTYTIPYRDQRQGWLCPKCQKAHAPWVETCPENPAVTYVTMGLSEPK